MAQALLRSTPPGIGGTFPTGAPPVFSLPELVVQVKALACELPATHHVPLSRWSVEELTRHVCQTGLVERLGATTLWRWLHQDAIGPWQHRCWIVPPDPDFAAKAGLILDLYQRQWQGQDLQADEFVLPTDEKTSIQARRPLHQMKSTLLLDHPAKGADPE